MWHIILWLTTLATALSLTARRRPFLWPRFLRKDEIVFLSILQEEGPEIDTNLFITNKAKETSEKLVKSKYMSKIRGTSKVKLTMLGKAILKT